MPRSYKIGLLLHSNIQSGGNIAMLKHTSYLSDCGHDVSVIFQERFFPKDLSQVGLDLPVWFLDEFDASAHLDLVLTNWWECAYRFARLPAHRYVYFCHGDERMLYDDRSYDACIDVVFREDLELFAVNCQIAERLRVLSGKDVPVIPNGVDLTNSRSASSAVPPGAHQHLRVLVEGRAGVAWKRVPETVTMLKDIDGIEILHVSPDHSTDPAWGISSLSGVSYKDMAKIYKSCPIVVKLSTPPESFAMPVLEGFAAGATAVVTDFPGHEAYVENGTNALVVPIDDWSAARAAIEQLRDDPSLLARLRGEASKTAARFDWTRVSGEFSDRLFAGLRSGDVSVSILPLLDRYRQCYLDILAMKVRLAQLGQL